MIHYPSKPNVSFFTYIKSEISAYPLIDRIKDMVHKTKYLKHQVQIKI